jgi:hypothetical protein
MLTGITAPGSEGEGLEEAELSDVVDIKEKGEGIYQMVDMVNSCIAVPVPFPLAIQTTGHGSGVLESSIFQGMSMYCMAILNGEDSSGPN